VVLALESSGPGGAERVVLMLAEALRDGGDEVSILTLRPGWMTERAEAAGIPVEVMPQRAGLDLAWIVRLARLLRRRKVDVFHSHEFAMNVFGGAAARLSGTPAIATIHGRHWVAEHPRRTRAYRVLHRLGMPVVAVSHQLAGFLAERFGLALEQIRVVHNGAAIPREMRRDPRLQQAARRDLGLAIEGPLLVAVGNLYAVKDHATLLRALAELPGVHAAIAGRGEEEDRLRRLAVELRISERVHLLGLRDDVDRVLQAGDVFVQPSLSEGLPIAILEAMAHGLPVVATRVGGVAEAVLDGETGSLVCPGDPHALASALRRLIEAPDTGAAFGAAGRVRAEAAFSVESMRRGYRALYPDRPAQRARVG
jgi:glycosyltransferase involved in cell wall biosynthesis